MICACPVNVHIYSDTFTFAVFGASGRFPHDCTLEDARARNLHLQERAVEGRFVFLVGEKQL